MTTVAVAVDSGGSGRGSGSRRAVRWAVKNLLPQADRFVLVHVMAAITHISSSSRDRIPIKDADPNIVEKYSADVRRKAQEIFVQYERLFSSTKLELETMLLENDNVADALTEYIKQSSIGSFVMGSESTGHFWRYCIPW